MKHLLLDVGHLRLAQTMLGASDLTACIILSAFDIGHTSSPSTNLHPPSFSILSPTAWLVLSQYKRLLQEFFMAILSYVTYQSIRKLSLISA